ncbi:MAG: hypothetical protein IJX65_00435 [Alistipes sp.]|nr:hypothetical protein [Alistipes sp.]
MSYKPIGGVQSVALRFVAVTEQIAVPLIDDASEYKQTVVASELGVVHHVLTLVARRDDAQPWLGEEFALRAVLEGVVATLTLEDGRECTLGSPDIPLRLDTLQSTSALSPSDEPTVTLTLRCETLTLN